MTQKHTKKLQRWTKDLFTREARKIHKIAYDYSSVEFNSIRDKIRIGCPIHGEFTQMVQAHIHNKQGCPSCFKLNRSRIPDFEGKAAKIHGDRYEYSKTDLENRMAGKIVVTCRSHGDFLVRPADHIHPKKKRGCMKCRGDGQAIRNKRRTLTTETWVIKAKKKHSEYSYEKSVYRGRNQPITITCPRHGDFEQIATYHVQGAGCAQCANDNKSKMETHWLDTFGVTERQKKIRIGTTMLVVDGYDETTNTIYEFFGDYWHGNPEIYPTGYNHRNKKSFESLYKDTIKRIELIESAGYVLKYIWESEWVKIDGHSL